MTNFNLTRILSGAAAAVAVTIAMSGGVFAHGMGGGHMGNMVEHNTSTNVTGNNKLTHLGNHDGRRFRFIRFGYLGNSPVCIYKWTELGRVRVCPNYDY
jgi:hypothetical protein